jgi:hypothetical protein
MDGQITVPQIPCPGRNNGRRANGRTRGDLLTCDHTGHAALHATPGTPLPIAPFTQFRPQAQGRTSEALARERLHPVAFPLFGQHASYLPFMACQRNSYLLHSICRGSARVNSDHVTSALVRPTRLQPWPPACDSVDIAAKAFGDTDHRDIEAIAVASWYTLGGIRAEIPSVSLFWWYLRN